MGTYSQLLEWERKAIDRLHAAGLSRRRIAAFLDRHPSTIGRELRRNSRPSRHWPAGRYEAQRATELTHRRRYRGHHRTAQKDYWNHLLPRHKHRRGRHRRRGASSVHFIQNRVPLSERPAAPDARAEAGHWEGDLMLFSTYGQAVLVVHERLSRLIRICLQPSKAAQPVLDSLTALFRPMPKALRRSVTFDNGSEFAFHYKLAPLHLKTFFCEPHSPWQKGGVENAIGRLRRSLPRKSDLNTITQERLHELANRYNTTPRKCLDFQTPQEVFKNLSNPVALRT